MLNRMILSQALCSLFCLASLTQHKAFEINPCCCTYQKFVLLRHILLFDCPTLCLSIYLLVDIRLFLVLEQKTAVNICVPILCVHVLSFLLGKHPTKMAGSYSKNVVDCKNLPINGPKELCHFALTSNVWEFQLLHNFTNIKYYQSF